MVQVLQGKVWVWGASGPTAQRESAAKTPPIVEELDINERGKAADAGWRVIAPVVEGHTRDFLYSYGHTHKPRFLEHMGVTF